MEPRSIVLAASLLTLSCGRLGYDAAQNEATAEPDADLIGSTVADASAPDAEAPPDATTICPLDMVAIPGSSACIDLDDRGSAAWHDASAMCTVLGRSLCSDAQWYAACTSAPQGLVNMTNGWEWLSELESDTSAYKRGSSSCEDFGSHGLEGLYQIRCCLSLD